jgi:hypothetical protein
LLKDNSGENSPSSATNNDNSADPEWRTGYINGNTYRNKEVKYRIINGMAIFEGDIILARTPQEIERLSPEHKVPSENEPSVRPSVKAVVRTGDQYRWPRGEIPFVIQTTLPNQNRVNDAIRHWELNTPIRFVQRTSTNASYYPNYVSFKQYAPQPNEIQEEVFHCSSPIGMQGGGEQLVLVSDQCVTGDVMHEIGHTVGLWHEQSREDRDKYIRIVWANVEPKSEHNFSQHINDGDDVGEYDYCSIMHYGAWFFNGNSGKQTIEILKPELLCGNANSIGQKNGLSKGDIAAAVNMYGNVTPSIIQNNDGKLEAFSLLSDMKLYRKRQTSPGNSSVWEPSNVKVGDKWEQKWSPIGLDTIFLAGDRPVITKDASGRLDVLWENGNEYQLRTQASPNSSWEGRMGSELGAGDWDGDPVIARNANGTPEVFWVHEDPSRNYVLHHMLLYNLQQSLPSLGGRSWSPNRKPIVAHNYDGRLEVFMVGSDRQLYHRWQSSPNSSSWSEDWISLGGPLLGDPAVARDVDGRLEVFKVDPHNRQLYYRWQKSPGESVDWSDGWDPLGGNWSLRRTPTIAQNYDGRLEIFMVDSNDGRLYHLWQTTRGNIPGSWEWYMNWIPMNWAPFEKEQWPPSSNPAVVRNTDGRLEVFMVDSKGQFYHTWQTVRSDSSQWSKEWALL